MALNTAYVVPYAARIKRQARIPVFVTGRINQPQDAEAVIASHHADVCGMTRALICDPEMPNKAARGAAEDIRACIACNQACIGHFHKGYPISCIQNPVSGRELRFGTLLPGRAPQEGHGRRRRTGRHEGRGDRGASADIRPRCSRRSGGSAARRCSRRCCPGRAEFGGIITNLQRELELAGVRGPQGRARRPRR